MKAIGPVLSRNQVIEELSRHGVDNKFSIGEFFEEIASDPSGNYPASKVLRFWTAKQKVTECYTYSDTTGYVNRLKEWHDWPPSTYRFSSLIHSQEINKQGLYGPHIRW